MSDLERLQAETANIQRRFQAWNEKAGHKAWYGTAEAMALVGDVGALLQHIMALESWRDSTKTTKKYLAQQLANCLWGVLTLANIFDVDLETEYQQTLKSLHERTKQ